MSVDAFVAGTYLVLGAFFVVVGLVNLISGSASRSWEAVSGEIIESRVAYSSLGRHWSVEIRYRYTVEGLTLEGDQFSFGKRLWFASRDAAERVVSTYHKGRIVRLLVSPSDRSVAVIEPGIGWHAVMMTLTGALLAAWSVYSFVR
jgi:uncharacterized protein DUF3592